MTNLDNARPDCSNYPTGEESAFHYGEHLLVDVGEYVVNRDGDIVIATTCNKGNFDNEFIKSLNEPYFRAKYVGNSGDYLEYANQCRKASAGEIQRAMQFKPSAIKVTLGGQLQLC